MKIIYLAILLLLTGCAGLDVEDNRAGCSYLDGQGRYGSFTQYATGDAKGAHVYIGQKLVGKVAITCNADKQEVKID